MKNKICVATLCVTTLAVSTAVNAMEAMTDKQLSEQVGRDGISIKINPDQSGTLLSMDHLALIDNDGFSSVDVPDQTEAGALVLSGSDANPMQVDLVYAQNNTAPVQINIDSDAGTAADGAFVNINMQLPDYLQDIVVNVDSIGVANRLGGVLSEVAPIVRFEESMVVRFKTGANKGLNANIQLGDQPQDSLLYISRGSLEFIDMGRINLLSENTDESFSVMNADVKVSATDVNNGFRLAGFKAGIDQDGLVVSKAGATDRLNIGLNNISFTQPQGSEVSMGNINVTGARVNDLQIDIRGK